MSVGHCKSQKMHLIPVKQKNRHRLSVGPKRGCLDLGFSPSFQGQLCPGSASVHGDAWQESPPGLIHASLFRRDRGPLSPHSKQSPGFLSLTLHSLHNILRTIHWQMEGNVLTGTPSWSWERGPLPLEHLSCCMSGRQKNLYALLNGETKGWWGLQPVISDRR